MQLLGTVAHGLNSGTDTEYWRKAEVIVTDWLSGKMSSMERAVNAFNSWAAKKPLRLCLNWRLKVDKINFKTGRVTSERGEREISAGTFLQIGEEVVVYALWQWFFNYPDRHRLKRCPECRKWYVDETMNAGKVRCSTSCTNKWWTLERRRKAGHYVPGSTRQSKRRARP